MNKIVKNIFVVAMVVAGGLLYTACSDMMKEYEEKLIVYPEITLDNFSPQSGRPGEQVTITGTNFGEFSEAATVTFNGVEVTDVENYVDNQMVVRVPADAGSGKILVKVWTHVKEFENEFTFIPGAKISSISPEEAPAGSQLTITGENFGTDASAVTVRFGGDIEAEIVSISDSQILVTIPEGGIRGAITLELGSQTLTGPIFSYPFVGLNYEFNTDGDSEGWLTSHNSTAEVSGGTINVTYDMTATKRRADFSLQGGAEVHAGLYPIVAIRMINKPTSGNFIFDTNLGKYKDGSNNWDGILVGDVYYYDLRSTFGSGATLSMTEPTALTTFQWKVADITTDETGYQVDWVKSFESLDALNEYVAPPRGKFIYEFNDPNPANYWVGMQNASSVIENGKLKVTFDQTQFEGTNKRRSDLNFIEGAAFPETTPNGKWHYSAEYPILAFKITFTGTGAPIPGQGSIKLDRFNGAQNNAYLTDFISENVIYYDCSIALTEDQDLASFTLKIADITSTEETGYEVDWIRSFKTKEELQAFIGQ